VSEASDKINIARAKRLEIINADEERSDERRYKELSVEERYEELSSSTTIILVASLLVGSSV